MSNIATWFLSYDVMYYTVLLHAMEHWTKSLDDGNDVDIIYLDFTRHLTVFHTSAYCLRKLKAYGISGDIVNWIMDFLSNS